MEEASARLTDEALACQTQAGSVEAFEELLRRYERRIYSFIVMQALNTADAAEVTQDTFVRAYEAIGRYDPRRPFAPWLFTIARRKCIDHYRARALPSATSAPEAVDTDDPSRILECHDERADLWQTARRVLSPAQFQSLWLRYAEDLPVKQIARVLGKTQTHVKVLLFRARLALGRELRAQRTTSQTVSTAKPGAILIPNAKVKPG